MRKVLKRTGCYTKRFCDTSRSLIRSADNGAKLQNVELRHLFLDISMKDDVKHEVVLESYAYDIDTCDTAKDVENAKKFSKVWLLHLASLRCVEASFIADLRRYNLMITDDQWRRHFYKITFAEAAFAYETLFEDIDASQYDKALVKHMTGKELDVMQVECK